MKGVFMEEVGYKLGCTGSGQAEEKLIWGRSPDLQSGQ